MSQKIIVYHSSFGCDCDGCCGHTVQMGDYEEFHFDHPLGQDPVEYAKQLVAATYGEDNVKDLDWENSVIVDD